ncbi:Ger(x)C family spore germination protein [Paenibacillus sp. sgz500958]|uniref:Ger(x)C family spore germination protein n=1 Tax=Paenibacillus sp. sgz500958 TaxID=3242475 RepID=UPI0036D2A693
MRKLMAAVLLMFLLTGCSGDQRILEKLGMVQTSSFDLLDDHKLKVTSCIPVIDPDSSVSREILTAKTNSLKEARVEFSRQTDLRVVSGQIRNFLFGLELAKEGLEDYIDTLLRDPSIALGVKVTVVNGDASELLSKEYKSHVDTGRYINHLVEKEGHVRSIPPTSLYEFSRDYHDDGIDPVVPIIKDAGDKAVIDGIALFRDDRYVSKISAKDGIIFALFRGDLKQGEMAFQLEPKKGKKVMMMFTSILSKRKIKVHHLGENRFRVDLFANLQGSILEYTGPNNLTKGQERHEVEREISDHINSKAAEMIRQMQQHKIDSLGIGIYVRNSLSYKEWTNLDWRKVYPEVEVVCHTKVTIKDYGKYM